MYKWLLGAIALVAALGGLVWLYGHQMDKARNDGMLAERTVWQAREQAATEARAAVEADLQRQMTARFDDLLTIVGRTQAAQAEIEVRLPDLLAASPRYTDEACALTPGVLDQLNAARALSAVP